MNPFDSYMLNKVRRLKDLRTRYAATGEKALLAGVPEEDLEFVTGIWPRSSSASSTAKARQCSRKTPSSGGCELAVTWHKVPDT